MLGILFEVHLFFRCKQENKTNLYCFKILNYQLIIRINVYIKIDNVKIDFIKQTGRKIRSFIDHILENISI